MSKKKTTRPFLPNGKFIISDFDLPALRIQDDAVSFLVKHEGKEWITDGNVFIRRDCIEEDCFGVDFDPFQREAAIEKFFKKLPEAQEGVEKAARTDSLPRLLLLGDALWVVDLERKISANFNPAFLDIFRQCQDHGEHGVYVYLTAPLKEAFLFQMTQTGDDLAFLGMVMPRAIKKPPFLSKADRACMELIEENAHLNVLQEAASCA